MSDYIYVGKKVNHTLKQQDQDHTARQGQSFWQRPADITESGGEYQTEYSHRGKI